MRRSGNGLWPASGARPAAAWALVLGGVITVAAQPSPGRSVHQADADHAVHLPLTMRGFRLADLPVVRPVAATATAITPPTATASATPTITPTVGLPSPTPTDEPPTATDVPPTPTSTATPGLQCQNLLQNGGFESGPVSWSVSVNGQQQPASDAIQPRADAAVPPRSGEWIAWLGGLLQGLSVLESSGLISYVPQEVVSATLQYHAAMITEEMSNRRPNDWIRVRLEGARRNLLVEGSARSDEDFPTQRTWVSVAVDLTQYLATDQVRRVGLEVENDQERRSWFYFDDVSVRSCRAAPPGRAGR